MKNCPACKRNVDDAAIDCQWCGIVFAKWGQPRPAPVPAVASVPRGPSFVKWLLILMVPIVVVTGAYVMSKKRQKPVLEDRARANAEAIEKVQNLIGLTAIGMFNQKDFATYVQGGDLQAVQRYLKAGMSPDTSFGGSPVLISALSNRQWDMADALLQAGANPNVQEKHNGYTPLMVALENSPRAKTMVLQLLSRGADVRIVNNNGEDARQLAEKIGVADWLKDAPVLSSPIEGGALTRERVIQLVANVRRGDSTQQAAALDEIRRRGDPAVVSVFKLLEDSMYASDGLYVLGRLDGVPTHVHFALLRYIKDPKNTLPKRELAEVWMKSAKTDYSKTMMFEQLLDVEDFGNQTKIFAINGLREIGPAAKSVLPTLQRMRSNGDLRALVEAAIGSIDGP